MSRPLHLTSWKHELATRFRQLPAPVVVVLALYSFGMILGQVAGQTAVAFCLATHLGCAYHAVRKRLREFYLPAGAKSGVKQGIKRKDFDVSTCFASLLGWVLACGRAATWPWPSTSPTSATASMSCASAWSSMALASPSPGKSFGAASKTRGDLIGRNC